MQHSFKNTNQVQPTPPRRRLWTAKEGFEMFIFGGVCMLVEMLISMISCGMRCHLPRKSSRRYESARESAAAAGEGSPWREDTTHTNPDCCDLRCRSDCAGIDSVVRRRPRCSFPQSKTVTKKKRGSFVKYIQNVQ